VTSEVVSWHLVLWCPVLMWNLTFIMLWSSVYRSFYFRVPYLWCCGHFLLFSHLQLGPLPRNLIGHIFLCVFFKYLWEVKA
jgi:hypothetical protein